MLQPAPWYMGSLRLPHFGLPSLYSRKSYGSAEATEAKMTNANARKLDTQTTLAVEAPAIDLMASRSSLPALAASGRRRPGGGGPARSCGRGTPGSLGRRP